MEHGFAATLQASLGTIDATGVSGPWSYGVPICGRFISRVAFAAERQDLEMLRDWSGIGVGSGV